MTGKRGRPLKKAVERHTARLELRLTPQQLELLKQAADGKLATWARTVLLRAAKKRIKG